MKLIPQVSRLPHLIDLGIPGIATLVVTTTADRIIGIPSAPGDRIAEYRPGPAG